MLLAIDIGNTNITIGVFKYEGRTALRKPVHTWRLSTSKTRTEDEYGTQILDLFQHARLESDDIKGIALASVVPSLNHTFKHLVKKYFRQQPLFIDHVTSKKVLDVLALNPNEVGADRIANAAAAGTLYGGPAIVIDFGTATTFDCIDKRGNYIGGVITPGPNIAAESLAKFTAKLPRVAMVKPARVLGKTTVEGIQSGLYYGYIGLIKEILKRVSKEMGGSPKVIATGGLASLIIADMKEVKDVVPELTLEGIRIIWEKHR